MQERALVSSQSKAEGLRTRLQTSEQRVRELEEQIQNDDRVEVLEGKLQHTQDRAEEVAFQFSKLKQVKCTFFNIIL
jgi:chromosome segregation ATPase